MYSVSHTLIKSSVCIYVWWCQHAYVSQLCLQLVCVDIALFSLAMDGLFSNTLYALHALILSMYIHCGFTCTL